MSFVHLHVHSHYSFLSGLWKPGSYAKRAKELGMPAVALTDAGNMYGAFEFYKACKSEGIKGVVGVEFQVSRKGAGNRDKDNDIYQLVAIAKDFTGYQNLIQLVTKSYLEGYYYGKPRVDFDMLKEHREGLLAISGDHTGEIAQHVITGKGESFLRERVEFYESIFGKGDFYLEILEHPDRGIQSKVNQGFIELSNKFGYPIVGTNHVYYAKKDDNEAQDLLSCIGSGRPLEDPDRTSLIEGDYSLRSAEEMAELLAYCPRAVSATMEILEKIHLDIPYGQTLIPKFELPPASHVKYEEYIEKVRAINAKHSGDGPKIREIGDEEWDLRRLCYSGLNRRFDFGLDEDAVTELIHKLDVPTPDKKLSDMSLGELISLSQAYRTPGTNAVVAAMDDKKKEITDRIDYELTVVDLMGFNGYFNIVSDFINWAKDNGVPVGPGRWSAAGALLAYLSGITDTDPLKYGLLFERFLNPSRVSMPDIDVDFSDEGRERVLEYVRNKYGHDHVAQIATFGTMAARAAVKDVGKVLGIPFQEMNKLASLIPSKPGTKLKDALEESVEFKNAVEGDPRYSKVVQNALRLEGSVRQLGVHACAVIIAPRPMTDYTPLQHPPKDVATTVTQFSAKPLEDLGLLKMDFLGLRNLTIIERCLKIIKGQHGVDIDMLAIDYEDRNVFKVFAEGDTTGVFQFESAGMRKYLKELKPNKFEDIIAMVALYRPGPMAFIPVYIRRKAGIEKVSYMMEELEMVLMKRYGRDTVKEESAKLQRDLGPYLDVSYGIAVYQEQLMQLSQSMGGFSLGEADVLRRWVGKKIREVVEKIKIDFVKKAAETNGYKPETSEFIYEKMVMPAADYSFNKSHAACYSMISYQTAFLKAYYPTEFMTALMVSDEEDTERITMEIEECKAKGITVLPPDLGESMKHFTYIDKKNIRFGLKAIKGLGDAPIEAIRKGRENKPYETILDFLTEGGSDVVNRKTLEALTLSGALDRFGERASLLASIPKMTAYAKEHEHKNETAQIGLFDMGHVEMEHLRFNLEPAKPMTYEEKIKGEKVSIGYSVSGHALDGLKAYIEKRTIGAEHVKEFKKKLAEHESFDADSGEEIGEDGPARAAVAEKPKPGAAATEDGPPPTDDDAPKGKEAKDPKKKERDPRVRFLGYVTGVRNVQTKTGKMMAIANCDSFDFRFTIVIFPKDYETLGKLLEEDKIVLVEGGLKCSLENAEISVVANAIRNNTITSVREQAMDMKLFDPNAKVSFYDFSTEGGESESDKPHDEIFVIKIPRIAAKSDLVDFKEFLLGEPKGTIRVELDLNGQKIDTKISVADTAPVEAWVKRRWSE